MKRTYGGADSGKGAVCTWDGDKNVNHTPEILDQLSAVENRHQVGFLQAVRGHNTAEFTMLPQVDAALVTWLMHGPAPFMSRVMQVFMNFDNMISKDFEVSLANLKKSAEK